MPQLARESVDPDRSGEGSSGAAISGRASPPSWNRPAPERSASQDRHSRLARTIELDIIPRLVHVHRAAPLAPAAAPPDGAAPTAQDVEDFVQLVLAREGVPAQAFIDVLCQRGMSVETVYLDLLAPAAQHLSYLWTQDLCDFTQVTLGLARMQRLLHSLSPALGSVREHRSNARRVLLMPVRGEQETFGLSMVAEFFHHAGWEVNCGGRPEQWDAARLLESQWFDVVGLSAGIETGLEALRAYIEELRLASRNRDVSVLVGGPIFAGHPERVKFVGADACGLDGKQAPVHAEKLMARRNHTR